VEIKTPYRSTWLDNSKAKFLLGWKPHFGLKELIEDAWIYRRDEKELRHVEYPG
jgi:nucleoside-diphosphate-sugar epimerase